MALMELNKLFGSVSRRKQPWMSRADEAIFAMQDALLPPARHNVIFCACWIAVCRVVCDYLEKENSTLACARTLISPQGNNDTECSKK